MNELKTRDKPKIGLGGGCHWCTEAVFQELKGVFAVSQGWICSNEANQNPSEAITLYFDPEVISLGILIKIHLMTHASTSNHSMRGKYRSAVYFTSEAQKQEILNILSKLQLEFDQPLITQCLPLIDFKLNEESFLNYYQKQPDAPFCQTYISPKLALLRKEFRANVL